MPMIVSSTTGGTNYTSPFVSPVEETLHVKIDISTFNTSEIDADGYLKPGVPVALSTANLGTRVGIEAVAGSAVSAAYSGNTGNGTMGTVTVSSGAKAGVYKLTIIEPASDAGTFEVEDPDGLVVGTGTVAVAFSAGGLAFTLADGATDFVAGDGFNITVTLTGGGAQTSRIYGVTIEAVKLPLAVIPATNTTVASETGDCLVAIAVEGVINRDCAEDNLGRAYTAAELAAFATSRFTLTTT